MKHNLMYVDTCNFLSSYADTEVHRTMIEDHVRTEAYHRAIGQEPSFIKGKVVCDVGCGSGILSMFCAQAGAKKVYAIDASQIAVQAKKVVAANGFDDIITGYGHFVLYHCLHFLGVLLYFDTICIFAKCSFQFIADIPFF